MYQLFGQMDKNVGNTKLQIGDNTLNWAKINLNTLCLSMTI